MPGGRFFIGVIFVVFGTAAVFLVVATFTGGDNAPPTLFVVFWLGALGWNAYWWLFRLAAELMLDADSIDALSPLGTRRVAPRDLTAIRPMRLASSVAVFEVASERPILMMATKGIHEFTNEIARRRPELLIQLGWPARLAERMPGRSRIKRR